MAWPPRLHCTLHPECYHGHGQRPPFFEGWYYKLISGDESFRLAVIPGVFLGRDRAQHHAFVQVLDGVRGTATYCRFPVDAFSVDPRRLDVRIGPNRFTSDHLLLNLDEPGCRLQGEVRLGPLTPWPTSFTSPGVMGWYAWVPLMQCYHGIVSLDHGLSGRLEHNGASALLDGGRGYIEKDWGRAFPSAWIWMQTNHFATPETILTASVAIIPWWVGKFTGFLVGLWHQGRLYRFTTYTGARIESLVVSDHRVHLVFADRQHRLEIIAHRAAGGTLLAPTHVEMGVRVAETLNAEVEFTLRTLSGEIVCQGHGRNAGLEVCGDVPRMIELLDLSASAASSEVSALAPAAAT